MSDSGRTPTATPVDISGDFTAAELAAALQNAKTGKALGPYYLCPELIIHAGTALKSWLRSFLSSLRHLRILNSVVELLWSRFQSPHKPKQDPNNYRRFVSSIKSSKSTVSNSLLIHYSLINWLDFGMGDQLWIKKFTNPKHWFEGKRKSGAVLVDLIAAYDTVWHRGLTCKLFRLVSENWKYLSHRCNAQKTEIACRTFSGDLQGQNEALTQKHCEQLFPWCTPRMSAALQSGVAKFTLASLTVFLMTPCTLSLNVCFPYQWTIRQFWQISN